MKKILFMVAAVISMVFTACVKEDFNYGANAPAGTIEFTASFDAETKTTLSNGKTVWDAGDEISINGVKFIAKSAGETTKFLNAEGEDLTDFSAPYTAVYPYSMTLPDVQTVSAGSFADESVVSVAYIENKDSKDLSFKHVSSLIKFEVANEVTSDIVFEASQYLAGALTVNTDATYSVSNGGSKTITVKANGGKFVPGSEYYVSVLPTDENTTVDFSVKVDGFTVKSGNVSFTRNKIVDAKKINVKYVYLKPNVWLSDAPGFWAHFFNDKGNLDVKMIDSNEDGVYEVIVPNDLNKVVFCRVNATAVDLGKDWTNVYNKTEDLTIDTNANSCYYIEKWHINDDDSKPSEGAWKTKPKMLFFTPCSNWKADDARFAAYFFNSNTGENSWYSLTDFNRDGIFEAEAPSGYSGLIFCRMNPETTENNWDNKWNQTGNLTVPTNGKDYYYMSTIELGAWGDKNFTFPSLKSGYMYLKPSSEWLEGNAHFAAWIWKDNGSGKVYNFKPHESVQGIYELNLNGANKMIIFRMDPNITVTDGSSNWPGDNHWYKSSDLNITGNLYTIVEWHATGTGFSTITEF